MRINLKSLLSGPSVIGRAYGSFGSLNLVSGAYTYPMGSMYFDSEVRSEESESKKQVKSGRTIREIVEDLNSHRYNPDK